MSWSPHFLKLVWKLTINTSAQFSHLVMSNSCNSMYCSTPGFSVHHQLPELAQIHVLRVSNANQPSQPLSSPSPPAFNLSQHQGLFQWVSSKSFQWVSNGKTIALTIWTLVGNVISLLFNTLSRIVIGRIQFKNLQIEIYPVEVHL